MNGSGLSFKYSSTTRTVAARAAREDGSKGKDRDAGGFGDHLLEIKAVDDERLIAAGGIAVGVQLLGQ